MARLIEEPYSEKLIKKILKAKHPHYDMSDYNGCDYFQTYYLENFVELSDFETEEGDKFEVLDQELEEEGSRECYRTFSFQEANQRVPLYYQYLFDYVSLNGYEFENAKLYEVKRSVETIVKFE